MPVDWISALRTSPLFERLAESATLISAGRYVEAVALLEGAIAQLEASNASPPFITPFLQLTAEGLRHAAAQFASVHPYLSRVDQRVRLGWLEQALEVYRRLGDVPNQVATLRAMSSINMALGEALSAMYQLKELGNLALPRDLLDVQQTHQLFVQLADAYDAAFDKAADHRTGIHYNLAIEGAAFRHLAGDSARAFGNLDTLHERYLSAAQEVHKSGSYDRASRLLASGIYWGLVAGRSEVLEQNADLLVNYMAQSGDAEAIAIYDRVITLRRARVHGVAQNMVLKQAMVILARHMASSHLRLFHDVVDTVSQYQIETLDRALKDMDPFDTKIPELAGAKRKAALLQLTSWAQSLGGLVPALKETDNLELRDFFGAGFATSLQKAHHVFGTADQQIKGYYDAVGTSPVRVASPETLRAVHSIQWSDPGNVQQICTALARVLDVSPLEIELALMPNGVGSPAEQRIRQTMGSFDWERVRRAAMARGLLDHLSTWQDVELKMDRR